MELVAKRHTVSVGSLTVRFKPDGVQSEYSSHNGGVSPGVCKAPGPLSCPDLTCKVALKMMMMLGGRRRCKKSWYSGMYALAVHGKVTTKPARSRSQ